MHAAIRAIEYHLPENTISTADLAAQFPDWSAEKIDAKTGIECRHIAATDECASDLAVDGYEGYLARLREEGQTPPPEPAPDLPAIAYTLEHPPPDNWIPLVPVFRYGCHG